MIKTKNDNKVGVNPEKEGKPIRLTIDLNARGAGMLHDVAEWVDITMADVLRNGLLLYHFIEKQRKLGNTVSFLVKGPDGAEKEVVPLV